MASVIAKNAIAIIFVDNFEMTTLNIQNQTQIERIQLAFIPNQANSSSYASMVSTLAKLFSGEQSIIFQVFTQT